MRIVFFGSPDFALPSLEALLESQHDVVAAVSQPDRPAGRGHAATAPPVKLLALSRGVPVLQPENVSSADSVKTLQALEPDVFIVAAYGQILRQRLLDVPRRGILNVHASLLPRHRGASPVAAAILAGDEITGVTLMEMVRALDAGPMVTRVEVPISPQDTTGTLEPRLASAGAALLAESVDAWAAGDLTSTPQDEALVTYAPQIKRADALLDWSLPAVDLWRRVRAFNPWPVAHTRWRGEELRILEAWPLPWESGEPPGTVLPASALPEEADDPEATFSVATTVGALAVRRLQRPGKRALSGAEFLRGQRDFVGQRLGSDA
jgi:methionyl-tRNA formyltransferase